MQKLIVAANWKMNLDTEGSRSLAEGLKHQLSDCENLDLIDVVVCPPYVYLPVVAGALGGSEIKLGAQDVYFESNGAFTGEISVQMLKDAGCSHLFLGHSERRHIMGESDELVNKKVKAAVAGGLEVALCIGELLEERDRGQTELVIERQLRAGLAGVEAEQMDHIILGYEPVWAIGTGRTATPDQAQNVHVFIRELLADIFNENRAGNTRIAYGGSVKYNTVADMLAQPDIDGLLVGGESLKIDVFSNIVKESIRYAAYNCTAAGRHNSNLKTNK